MNFNFTFGKKKETTHVEGGPCKETTDFKDFFSFRNKRLDEAVPRDWVLLFVSMVVLLIIVFVVSGYIFRGTFFIREQSQQFTPEHQNEGVNLGALHSVVTTYKQKKETFQDLEENPPRVVDPS